MTQPRAILVWQDVTDPLPKDESRLYSALSSHGVDVADHSHPGVILLRQDVEQVRASGLQHPGWTLYVETQADG